MTISGESRRADKREGVQPTLQSLRDPVQFIALGAGTGLVPFAPGTFGSLLGLLLWFLLAPFGWHAQCAAAALAIAVGIPVCGASARKLGVHDHAAIVWDEVAGMLIALLAAPRTWWGVFLAFALFRLFDIWKPWPIRLADRRVHGGIGIMLDDVLAGILAVAVLLFVQVFR